MFLIECAGLSFLHGVVDDLSFGVSSGDYLVIFGENGTGKSTLIAGILGLKRAVLGKVIFSKDLLRSQIGYLPQRTEIQRDFPASVMEVVLSGFLGRKGFFSFYSKEDNEIARRNMEECGIQNLKNKCYRELSGGQQQRVLLARALCASTRLMVLDEPMNSLDPAISNDIYNSIAKFNKNGMAVIMATHDTMALRCATHVLHLNKKQNFYGTKKQYQMSVQYEEFINKSR